MSSGEDRQYNVHDYLCYQILHQLERYQNEGRSIPRTQFLKLAPIADRKLSDEFGQEINLPRYWYMYGEVLNENPINSGVYNTTPAPWDGKQVQLSPGINDDSFEVDEEVRRDIIEVARRLASEFANESSSVIKDLQYEEYAPTEFIRDFDRFRNYIQRIDEQNTTLAQFASDNASSRAEDAQEFLDDLVVDYPVEAYDEAHGLFLEWEDTTRLMLEQGRSFDEVSNLLEDFWETFSKVELQIKHQQNTPPSQLNRRIREAERDKEEFVHRLEDIREALLRQEESDNILESVSESYSETVRRHL